MNIFKLIKLFFEIVAGKNKSKQLNTQKDEIRTHTAQLKIAEEKLKNQLKTETNKLKETIKTGNNITKQKDIIKKISVLKKRLSGTKNLININNNMEKTISSALTMLESFSEKKKELKAKRKSLNKKTSQLNKQKKKSRKENAQYTKTLNQPPLSSQISQKSLDQLSNNNQASFSNGGTVSNGRSTRLSSQKKQPNTKTKKPFRKYPKVG